MYNDELCYGLFLSDRQLDFLFNYPQGFDRMKCFATFLRMAVREPTHYEKKDYSVDLTPGQFAVSEVELAKLWKCNRKTASKMVDLFHEVGLVSSVPNCRTTVFTVHCVASWYIGSQSIRNKHYSRHPHVEQRVKANHKSVNAADAIEDNSLSLYSNHHDEIDGGASANQSDEQTAQQMDGYTSQQSDFISNEDNIDGDDRERKPSNDGDEPSTMNEESHCATINLPTSASASDSTGNDTRPSSELPGKAQTDDTTTVPVETTTDDTE